MKKILFLFAAFLFVLTTKVFADSYVISNEEMTKAQRNVRQVGFKLLNANEIPTRAIFLFDSKKSVNAYSAYTDRHIVVYRGMYNMLDDEDELAAVLGHEISHSVDSYNGIFRGYFSPLNYIHAPKKYEYKADKRAVDYMVKAGYHPVAMIVMLNKVASQERFDWCSAHPLSTRRMMEVYEYIYKKYPEYLVNNKYKTNPYYQNFLLTSKENRAKFQEKVKSNSTRKAHYL